MMLHPGLCMRGPQERCLKGRREKLVWNQPWYDGANLRPIDIQKCKESWIRFGRGRDLPKENNKNKDEEKEIDEVLAAPATGRKLKALCSKYKPTGVFLMETRAKEDKVESLQRRLRFSNSSVFKQEGCRGGWVYCGTTSSDHSPLVIQINPNASSGRMFRFEAFWEEHADCAEVVSRGWNAGMKAQHEWGSVLNNISACKRELEQWHEFTFKRPLEEIQQLKRRLQILQNSATSNDQWQE
ncbi:hypothetical protein SESBI_50052, partial [Sesbania bispinosa]